MSEVTSKKLREDIERYLMFLRNNRHENLIDWSLFSTQGNEIKPSNILVIDSPQNSNYSNLENKIEELNKKFNSLSESFESIKSAIYESDTTKEESILYFKEKLNAIKEVRKVYCKQDAEGISFWIFFKTRNTSKTLSEIVNVEIDLDSKFPDVFFNFFIDPLNETLAKFERKQWSPLISRD